MCMCMNARDLYGYVHVYACMHVHVYVYVYVYVCVCVYVYMYASVVFLSAVCYPPAHAPTCNSSTAVAWTIMCTNNHHSTITY